MTTIISRLMHSNATSVTKWYNLFAAETRALSSHFKFQSPSGNSSERNGGGPETTLPDFKRKGMERARLLAPHGGAMKTPLQAVEFIHCLTRALPGFVVKPAIRTFHSS